MSVERYNPVLIVLHWLVALILVVALLMGTFVLSEIPNSSPEKIDALKGHMSAGLLLLVLMIVRLLVRLVSKRPAPLSTGNPLQDKLGVAVHYGFYIFVIAMALSGMALSAAAGLPDIVFNASGEALPKDFSQFTPRIVHGIIAKILIVLVLMHIAAAFMHQFKLKDNIMARMKFGGRK